VKTENKN